MMRVSSGSKKNNRIPTDGRCRDVLNPGNGWTKSGSSQIYSGMTVHAGMGCNCCREVRVIEKTREEAGMSL